MAADFDRDYWQRQWQQGRSDGASGAAAMAVAPPNPQLVTEVADLEPGSALDVGCGAGAEALWLAAQGWRVTAADIAAEALAIAARRAAVSGIGENIHWVEADLTTWHPQRSYDLVTTHYAHPAEPQLTFYARIAEWVAPGGTLLVVGHAAHGADRERSGHHPQKAAITAAVAAGVLDETRWRVVTAEQRRRVMGDGVELHDVVVRARRLA